MKLNKSVILLLPAILLGACENGKEIELAKQNELIKQQNELLMQQQKQSQVTTSVQKQEQPVVQKEEVKGHPVLSDKDLQKLLATGVIGYYNIIDQQCPPDMKQDEGLAESFCTQFKTVADMKKWFNKYFTNMAWEEFAKDHKPVERNGRVEGEYATGVWVYDYSSAKIKKFTINGDTAEVIAEAPYTGPGDDKKLGKSTFTMTWERDGWKLPGIIKFN